MSSRLLRISILVLLAFAGAAYAAGQDKTAKMDDPAASPAKAESMASVSPDISGKQQHADAPVLKQRDPRYKLTRNDVLVIDFPFTPEYNETVTVQPDGFINLKQLPDMHVEGMATPEVTDALKVAYSKLLHEPVITVVLQTFLNPYFIAQGEVKNPGKFQLYGDTSVVQAIGIAGGFTSSAKHSEVYLFRRVSDQWVSSQKLDIKQMLKSGNLAEDLHLQPGDMLWVPKSGVAKLLSIQPLIPWNQFRVNFGPFQ
ncbi:MAG: polysaccharide biosynthesis/export family protein [Acidobacteriia bacterium]|nr:polysaccharide biosynthesis/export family protein [Terriglobia bacterium]